jgi:hypothetical protein
MVGGLLGGVDLVVFCERPAEETVFVDVGRRFFGGVSLEPDSSGER